MIGTESNNRGRSPEVEDYEILNVIRRSENVAVPTSDIANDPAITIGKEGLRQRLNALEDQNRVSSRASGNIRMWRLGELESDEPVREPAMDKAHRWANVIRELGNTFGFFAIGFAFFAVLFFIMFLHAQAGQLDPPFLSQQETLFTGYAAGYLSAALGVLAGTCLGTATIIPKATAWKLNRTETDQETSGES